MKVLYDNNKIKKTNLAMYSGQSYNNLILYLNWLETIDLIKKEVDEDGFELISLSDKGRDLYVQKLK
jgi:predicted transcriptional regulator